MNKGAQTLLALTSATVEWATSYEETTGPATVTTHTHTCMHARTQASGSGHLSQFKEYPLPC